MKVFSLLIKSVLTVLSIGIAIVVALVIYYFYQKYTVSDDTKQIMKEMLMQDIFLNKDKGITLISNVHEVINQSPKEFILSKEVIVKRGKNVVCLVLLDEIELLSGKEQRDMIFKLIGAAKISVNAIDVNGHIYSFNKQEINWRAIGKVNETNKSLGELSVCMYQDSKQIVSIGTVLFSFSITSSDIININKIYWKEDVLKNQ